MSGVSYLIPKSCVYYLKPVSGVNYLKPVSSISYFKPGSGVSNFNPVSGVSNQCPLYVTSNQSLVFLASSRSVVNHNFNPEPCMTVVNPLIQPQIALKEAASCFDFWCNFQTMRFSSPITMQLNRLPSKL